MCFRGRGGLVLFYFFYYDGPLAYFFLYYRAFLDAVTYVAFVCFRGRGDLVPFFFDDAHFFLYYRAFLDAVTSHLFVFEGDGLVRNFEGSFSGCVVN